MAIDPKLVSIKKAGDLPSGIPTASGEFLYFEDETLKKAEMSDLYDRLESSYLGIITPSTTIPTTGSWYGTVLAAGTFSNVTPAITVDAADFDVENGTANNEVRIIISEGAATKGVRRAKGDKGDAGKTTEQWTAKAFTAGSTVYHGGNSIWEANANTLATDVPGVSPKWVLRIVANEITDGSRLINIVDNQGHVLGYYNKEGKFSTEFEDYSIENKALQKEIGTFFEGSEIVETFDWHRVFTDAEGHILGGIKKDGSLYWNKIDSENIVGVVRQELEKREYELEITKETYLNFDFPDSVVDVNVHGILPTDITDARTPTNVILTFSKGGQFLFRCKGIMAVQGQGSVGYAKKGYEIDFINANGKSLMVKWGKMHAVDAINFKAFYTDPTMTKDVSAGRLWHKIRTSRPFPSSFIADFTASTTSTNAKYQYFDDALFYAEGFPMRMTVNGLPYGLYVWRMKKKRENYRMDNGNLNNIFLDSAINTGISLSTWNPVHWDLKSPKISGYEEGGPITNPTVLASITRYFDWMSACIAGTVDMRATYQDYINLDSWIDYIIACEVVYAGDSNVNNTEFMTWDGLRWSLCIYDQDNTVGYMNGVLYPANLSQALRADWWLKVKSVFLVEIKARYTELRNNILSMNSIKDIYSEIPKTIPTDYYIENLAIWGWAGFNHEPKNSVSLRQILDYMVQRLAYLDTIYKN